jgi:hypothetical protein
MHLWGCHIVGGLLMAAGSGVLVSAVMLWSLLSDSTFTRLLLISISCFAGAGAVAVSSIFTLAYFRGVGAAPVDGIAKQIQPDTVPTAEQP